MRKFRWGPIVAAAMVVLLSSTASADTGVGPYDHGRFNILAWTRAPPLSSLGEDAIRMSSTPALGGRGWVIELHRADAKWARGEARFLWTSRSKGQEAGRMRLSMPIADYEALTRRIDAALARGEPRTGGFMSQSGGPVMELIVCTDGPGYVSERRLSGKQTWLDGFCGENHPNDAIATLLQQAVLDYACGWFDMDRRCASEPDD